MVLDNFRAEFPGFFAALSRVRMPAVATEPPAWAFLSGLGASVIVSGVLHLALLAAPRAITDPSLQLPLGATLASIVTLAAHAVAGVVLVRAGGGRAVLIYAGFAAIEALSSLLAIQLSCDRSRFQLGMPDGGCNAPLLYIAAGRAPEWIGVAMGTMLARGISSSGPGANHVLRGGGAFSVTLFALWMPLSLAFNALPDLALQTWLYLLAYSIAGIVAGIVLRAARFEGALLVALAVVGPTLGVALPLMRGGPSREPLEFTFARYGGLLAPAIAGVCLVSAWTLARRRGRA